MEAPVRCTVEAGRQDALNMSPQHPNNPASSEAGPQPAPGGSVMSLVRRLRGVSWEWREDVQSEHSGKDMGVIAQEVEEVFPELVHTDEDGYKSVNYAGLIAPLIEAVKELDARLEALEKERQPR